MQIYPHNALDQLEFPKLCAELAELASGLPVKSSLQQLKPNSNKDEILRSYVEVDCLLQSLRLGDYLGLRGWGVPKDLSACFRIENYVLSGTGIQQLRHILVNVKSCRQFEQRWHEHEFENAQWVFDAWPDVDELQKFMDNKLDEEGNIKRDASDELRSINRKIEKKQGEISGVFTRISKQYRAEGLLSEIEESHRNGRRVLALPVENKRRVNGIIHGESESGKTIFLEPQAVTEINNAIFQLERERQREEYKIMLEICDHVRIYQTELESSIELLKTLDGAYAKAVYSYQRNLNIPIVDDNATLHIKNGWHPHLDAHLRSESKKIVKNDIVLFGANRILLLSGPNAGGKSITLKTVAFAQCMFQAGLPVPADSDSHFRVFNCLALDMGDNQSIEDDLSTYSSHLDHMRHMLELASEETLILIDEFGTGTDPRVGGALAESILYQFVKKCVSGVITTHYSNLKSFAHKTKGIVNGSMSFDMKKLEPTYHIQIGKPGSSFAFEIAERMGLPQSIIKQARKKAGTQVYEMEKLLSQLTHEKDQLEKRESALEQQEKALASLQATYTSLKKELDIKRKQYKAEKKEEMARLKSDNIKELEKMLAEYRNVAEAEKKLQEKIEKEKEAQKRKIDEAKSLQNEAHKLSGQWLKREDVKVGDFVRLRDADATGEVLAVKKKSVRVAVGALAMEVPYENLVSAKEPLEINKTRSIKYSKPTGHVPSRLDIRGMSFKDAEGILTRYFDDALVRHIPQIEIVHGIGNGVLKKLVKQIADSYRDIREIYHPEQEFGGTGVTIVRF